jgi:hypothetical protein
MVRSVGFSLRKAKEYIHFPIETSWKGYEKKWFYIRLPDENVIKGKGLMPVINETWKAVPPFTEKMQGHIKHRVLVSILRNVLHEQDNVTAY